MKHFFKLTLIVSIGCGLLFSCKKKDEKPVNNFGAYFGGTFHGVSYPFVLLVKNSKTVDTLPVNEHNEFGKKFNALIPGMYTLVYGPFSENIFFEKNDRISIKITSGDFGNNVEYIGKGSNKNNFLKELLGLVNDEQHDCSFLYSKPYATFKTSADSLRDSRRALYLRKKTEFGWDKDFDKYARPVIDYAYYTTLEQYSLSRLGKTGGGITDSLPSNYYDFRSKVDFNNETLCGLKPYTGYLALLSEVYARNSKQHSQSRTALTALHVADSLISNPTIKNKVTEQLAYSYMLSDLMVQPSNEYIAYLKKINTDTDQKNALTAFIKKTDDFRNLKQLPSFDLSDSDGSPFTSFKGKQESLLLFWSSSYDDLYRKMLGLLGSFKTKNPKLNVYVINTDLDEKSWKEKISADHTGIIHLRAENFNDLREKWIICSPKRALLLHPDGTLKTPFFRLLPLKDVNN